MLKHQDTPTPPSRPFTTDEVHDKTLIDINPNSEKYSSKTDLLITAIEHK